jgi:hypothetical protein
MKKVLVLVLAVTVLSTLALGKRKKEVYSGPCKIGVSTVTMTSEGPQDDAPDYFLHWWEKNAKNYPEFCTTRKDFPIKDGKNFLIAFSSNESSFLGFIPTTRTYTTTSPFNANGTVTNQYGDRWNYTVDGTVMTTTTMQYNAAYQDHDMRLYIRTYNSSGQLIKQDAHIYSSRTGGDPYNSLGYNLGGLIAAAGARGRMINSAFKAMENDMESTTVQQAIVPIPPVTVPVPPVRVSVPVKFEHYCNAINTDNQGNETCMDK